MKPWGQCIELKIPVAELLAHIASSEGSFSHQKSEEVAGKLGVSVQSDRTHTKGDLGFKFIRPDTGAASSEHEVSVKSWLGQNPSLFNASILEGRVQTHHIGLPREQFTVYGNKTLCTRQPKGQNLLTHDMATSGVVKMA